MHHYRIMLLWHAVTGVRVAQFVEKDPKLAEPVLKALLKYWPVTNSQKEVLFLGELEEILEMTQAWSRGLHSVLLSCCGLALLSMQSHSNTSFGVVPPMAGQNGIVCRH